MQLVCKSKKKNLKNSKISLLYKRLVIHHFLSAPSQRNQQLRINYLDCDQSKKQLLLEAPLADQPPSSTAYHSLVPHLAVLAPPVGQAFTTSNEQFMHGSCLLTSGLKNEVDTIHLSSKTNADKVSFS